MAEYTIADYDTAPEHVKAFFDTMKLFVPDVKFVVPQPSRKSKCYGRFIFTDVFRQDVSAGRVLAIECMEEMPLVKTFAVKLMDNYDNLLSDPLNYRPTFGWKAYI